MQTSWNFWLSDQSFTASHCCNMNVYDMGIDEQLIYEKTGERTEVIKT